MATLLKSTGDVVRALVKNVSKEANVIDIKQILEVKASGHVPIVSLGVFIENYFDLGSTGTIHVDGVEIAHAESSY